MEGVAATGARTALLCVRKSTNGQIWILSVTKQGLSRLVWMADALCGRLLEFDDDVKAAVGNALKSTKYIDGINPADTNNLWATIAPKWKNRLGGFDVFVWDQCYAMEQSLRVD
jgi:hypothetical protein